MEKINYVLVTFSDGDARVYLKRTVTKAVVRGWNKLRGKGQTTVDSEIVAESTDKDALVRMANLARHEYALQLSSRGYGDVLTDRTEAREFP